MESWGPSVCKGEEYLKTLVEPRKSKPSCLGDFVQNFREELMILVPWNCFSPALLAKPTSTLLQKAILYGSGQQKAIPSSQAERCVAVALVHGVCSDQLADTASVLKTFMNSFVLRSVKAQRFDQCCKFLSRTKGCNDEHGCTVTRRLF